MHPFARRPFPRRSLVATTALFAAAILVAPTPAHAQGGWADVSVETVNESLTTSWTSLGPTFRIRTNEAWRYCVTVKGSGTVQFGSTVFEKVATVDSSSYVTRCSAEYRHPESYGEAKFFQTPKVKRVGSGSVTVGKVTVQQRAEAGMAG